MFQNNEEDEAVDADERGELIDGVWVRGLPQDPRIDPPPDEELVVTLPDGLIEDEQTTDEVEEAGLGQAGPLSDVAAFSAVGRVVRGDVGARRAPAERSPAVVWGLFIAVPLLVILAMVIYLLLG